MFKSETVLVTAVVAVAFVAAVVCCYDFLLTAKAAASTVAKVL